MNKIRHRSPAARRLLRVRSKVRGNQEQPRLCVVRTNQHIYTQVINDEQGITLVAANDLKKSAKSDKSTKTERAVRVANELAEKMAKAKINRVVFDRGTARYHGRVKVIAETLREKGIQL